MAPRLLSHPLTRGIDPDHPKATVLRRRIISEKRFLRKLYQEWHAVIQENVSDASESVLELGSGAGFLRETMPQVITSDLLPLPDLSVVLDAGRLPIRDESLTAIVMIDVLHHLPDVELFFREAGRCVKQGGRIVMIEPWVTPWSRFVYGRLHHEPFDPERDEWGFPSSGPLSGANGALPWMVFHRDFKRFSRKFPQWRRESVKLDMPFSYLVSGGVSLRSLAPGAAYRAVRRLEKRLDRWMDKLAMFAYITLTRQRD